MTNVRVCNSVKKADIDSCLNNIKNTDDEVVILNYPGSYDKVTIELGDKTITVMVNDLLDAINNAKDFLIPRHF